MKTYVGTIVGVLVVSMGCSSTESSLAYAGVRRVEPLPRLMGDTWQFFSQRQDKRAGYFKDKKAVEAYYNPLYQALKRRNPAADAKAAAERGQRLLLGMYYGSSARVYTIGDAWNRFGPVEFKDDASFKRCGGVNYKRLEGTSNTVGDCKGVKACESYDNLAEAYVYRFNNVMVTYCNKPPQNK